MRSFAAIGTKASLYRHPWRLEIICLALVLSGVAALEALGHDP
jgi:hypothetical protein